jgi:hypothetical protein
MDIPLRQVKSRPHASQVLIAHPHSTAVPEFQLRLVRVAKATHAVCLAAATGARMVVYAALVGGEALLVVWSPHGHALLGDAGPQHPNPDTPKISRRVIHESLALRAPYWVTYAVCAQTVRKSSDFCKASVIEVLAD